jgi:hypothetical protein
LLRHTGIWIARFGIGIEGVGQAALSCSAWCRGPPTGYIVKMGLTPK